ncbi:hypothetical protein [Ekhidna sp.]|uniref:hypothetical protein n=1 Tax=Ekhidna sp. TaxID=2608089 RepID=UPI003B5039F2
MKFLLYLIFILSLSYSSFCQSYSRGFQLHPSKSFHLQVGTGISVSDGAFGQAYFLEPQLTFANNASLGFEMSYKNYKWLGSRHHKLNSFLLTYQVSKQGKVIKPYFSARLGYFRFHRMKDREMPSYGTFGGGLTSGIFISIVNIGIEMHWYTKYQPIEGGGGIFIKIRF